MNLYNFHMKSSSWRKWLSSNSPFLTSNKLTSCNHRLCLYCTTFHLYPLKVSSKSNLTSSKVVVWFLQPFSTPNICTALDFLISMFASLFNQVIKLGCFTSLWGWGILDYLRWRSFGSPRWRLSNFLYLRFAIGSLTTF